MSTSATLLDHLAELEARAAGLRTEPDAWHGSLITTPADLAPFTEHDLDEARSRLRRLGQLWDVRLRALTDQQLDSTDRDAWTLRQIAFHVAGSAFYADAVGDLHPTSRTSGPAIHLGQPRAPATWWGPPMRKLLEWMTTQASPAVRRGRPPPSPGELCASRS